MLLGSIFKKATQDPVTYRRVDTSSAAGVAEASRKPNIITDVQMGLGLIPEDSSYRARTERTKLRNKMASNKPDYGNDDSSPPRPRQPTEAELRAQRKAAALAERRRLGQVARKKFEKEKGERVAALRKKIATLLNVS